MNIEQWMPIAALAAVVALVALVAVALTLAFSRMSRMSEWFRRVDESQGKLGDMVLKLDAAQQAMKELVGSQPVEVQNRQEIQDLVKSFFGKDAVLRLSNTVGVQNNSIEHVQQVEVDKMRKEALRYYGQIGRAHV